MNLKEWKKDYEKKEKKEDEKKSRNKDSIWEEYQFTSLTVVIPYIPIN